MKFPKWLDRRIAAPGPYLVLCLSTDEVAAVAKRMKVTLDPRTCRGGRMTELVSPQGNTTCVVEISGYNDATPVEVAGLLIHEAVHVWQAYCRDIGETNPGDEQEAYAVQAIAQELLAEYARRIETGTIPVTGTLPP